jgi:hypothetical protein
MRSVQGGDGGPLLQWLPSALSPVPISSPFIVSRWLGWNNSQFAGTSSCWWTMSDRDGSRDHLLKGNDHGQGFALLSVFDRDNYHSESPLVHMTPYGISVRARGRSWVYPGEDGFILFNPYDRRYTRPTEKRTGDMYAKALLKILNQPGWGAVPLEGVRTLGYFYVNSGGAYMIGPREDIEKHRDQRVSFEGAFTNNYYECDHCGNRWPDGWWTEVHGERVCEGCADQARGMAAETASRDEDWLFIEEGAIPSLYRDLGLSSTLIRHIKNLGWSGAGAYMKFMAENDFQRPAGHRIPQDSWDMIIERIISYNKGRA